MYKQIYIPVDNSDHSNMAIDIGILLAKQFGAKVVGSHAYAAKLHDKRFKQMEAGLPEEYHDEKELERQRKIHDSLITRGLEIITDSYLDIIDNKCKETNVPLERRSLEGKNYKVVVDDVNQNGYDLVVMGALGVGACKDSQIGSVCERLVRRVKTTDVFVVKDLQPLNGGKRKILVAVDGSHQSFGGLKTALTLAKSFNLDVDVVSAFDPYFHYAMFSSISGVLSEEAGKVFRFKQQEKLHEEVIDSGLAKIYQSHLEISKKVAEEEGITVKIALLDGKPFEKVLQYIRRENPWLLVVGRIGVHSDEDMDIGSNSENLLRLAPCNILVSSRKFVPPIDAIAEYTVAWTEEANKRMERVPSFARGMAKTAVYRYAIEKGHTIISNAVVDAAMGDILPKGALEAMRNLGKTLDEKGIDRDKMLASDDVAQSLASQTLSGMVSQVADTSAEAKPLDYYLCESCGYTAKGAQPVQCPICNAGGEKFKLMDKSIFEAAAKAEGGVETDEAYDGVQLKWTDEARKLIRTVPAGFIRRRAKAKVDKLARKKGIETITKEFASPLIEEELAYVKAQQGGNGNAEDHLENGFSWTPEAKQRLERVPEGFMRDCTRGLIEKHAKTIGASTINLEIAHQGIEEGKRTMEDAMRNPALLDEIMAKLKVSKGETKNP
jgi:nucleotide-binding universal stress UspA family protein